MRNKFLFAIVTIGLLAVSAFAIPTPVEVYTGTQDTMKPVLGPDGKTMRNNAPVFVLHCKNVNPETPQPITGVSENEHIIQKAYVNALHDTPGQIYMVITAADNDEFLTSAQAVKGEKIFFRIFDTTDTTFASGTPYAESPLYVVPSSFGSIENLSFGEWKRIP